MKKTFLLVAILFSLTIHCFSQKQDKVDAYQLYKGYRNAGKNFPKHITNMLALLDSPPALNARQKTNVRYHIGRMYEEIKNPDSALYYYQQVLKDEPDYEVVHRALGFIYLEKSKLYVEQLNAAVKEKNAAANTKAFAGYKLMVQKALPHFEKYQACAPDDETLGMITKLYQSIKDSQSVVTLDARLKLLSKRCVTLLDDE